MHAAIRREGTDWAACAILLIYPDGAEISHPAMHAPSTPVPRLDLRDACTAVRVFPSAWNKLYRRAVLDGLRYREGSWFEDHEVFWALARRAPALAWVDQPLYRHRRNRPGQITGTDSDRVFDQLAVLERLHPLIVQGGFDHAQEGFARLATRLVHERALVLREPARRARFLHEAQALFDRLALRWSAGWDPEISRALPIEMAGDVAVSLVLLPGADAASLVQPGGVAASGRGRLEADGHRARGLPLAAQRLPLVRARLIGAPTVARAVADRAR